MNIKQITIIIIILIAAFFGVQKYASGADPNTLLIPELGFDKSVDNELLVLLLELRAIKLDGEIFSSKVFSSLKDFSTEIKAQPVGRNNPFANIGNDSSFQSTTAVGVQEQDLQAPLE